MKSATFAPAYVGLFPILSEVAQANGYSLAIHGSVSRDMDLVACPWTNEAVDPTTLANAIAHQVWTSNGEFDTGRKLDEGTHRPHGRLSWAIPLECGAYLDLSVMPTTTDGWQYFDENFDYQKDFYQVRLPDGTVIDECWPNDGKMNSPKGDVWANGVYVRPDEKHWMGDN